ncbi:hypothetical protein B0H21DRAFT_764428 [Amylocystis lapponica]|nr:hypothetical protein B0H21DRAFT_764428 [Amylocystis lapponica]
MHPLLFRVTTPNRMYARNLVVHGRRCCFLPHTCPPLNTTRIVARHLLQLSTLRSQCRTVSHVFGPQKDSVGERVESSSEPPEKHSTDDSTTGTSNISSRESTQPTVQSLQTMSSPNAHATTHSPKTLPALAEGLPSLPAAPRYPCPHLTKEEATTFLSSLYFRGWYIGRALPPADAPSAEGPAELVKQFEFVTPEHAIAFSCEVASIQEVEKHHSTLTRASGEVAMRIHTHSATPLPPDSTPGKSAGRPKRPGVTLRDVRLAFFVESVFQDHLDRRTGKASSQQIRPPDVFEPCSPSEVEIWNAMSGHSGS